MMILCFAEGGWLQATTGTRNSIPVKNSSTRCRLEGLVPRCFFMKECILVIRRRRRQRFPGRPGSDSEMTRSLYPSIANFSREVTTTAAPDLWLVLHFLIHKNNGCTQHTQSIHAFFQRICGLSGPRSHQKADSRKVYRERGGPCRDRASERGFGRRTLARGPDQR